MSDCQFNNSFQLPSRQHGVVLIVALILLLVLTIIGITSMSTTTLEERMAGNLRDKNTSLQAAEAALRDSDNWLVGLNSEPGTTSSSGACGSPPCDVFDATAKGDPGDDAPSPPLPDLTAQDHAWWLANGREYDVSGSVDITGVATDPRFVVELVKFVDDTGGELESQAQGFGSFYYRVTARGTGGADTTQTIVQATTKRRFK